MAFGDAVVDRKAVHGRFIAVVNHHLIAVPGLDGGDKAPATGQDTGGDLTRAELGPLAVLLASADQRLGHRPAIDGKLDQVHAADARGEQVVPAVAIPIEFRHGGGQFQAVVEHHAVPARRREVFRHWIRFQLQGGGVQRRLGADADDGQVHQLGLPIAVQIRPQ